MTHLVEAIASGGRKTRQASRASLADAKHIGQQFFFEEAETTRVYITTPRGRLLVARSDKRCTGPRFSHRVIWHKLH